MAQTLRAQLDSTLLLDYITKAIQPLEPQLIFANLGVRRDVPMGYDQLNFPQTNQIASTSVGTISEGTQPSTTTWGTTSVGRVGITQKGVLLQISDIAVRNSAVALLQDAVTRVNQALTRQIDVLLQATVMAASAYNSGTAVKYAGGKTARANLGAGDLIDHTLVTRAVTLLRGSGNGGVQPFNNQAYVFVAHPNQEHDLMQNASAGGWLDIGRYTSVQELRDGKMDAFRGVRVMRSANVQTFSSTVTVYPGIVLGDEAYGWGYFQPPTPYMVTTPDSNNGLNLYSSIGAKFGLGVANFSDNNRTVRIESAVSS